MNDNTFNNLDMAALNPNSLEQGKGMEAIMPLLESVVIARASVLARDGHTGQAIKLLVPYVNRQNAGTGAIDLLAKLYAQQGSIEQAEFLWEKALEKEPSNENYMRALQCCKRYKKAAPNYNIMKLFKPLFTGILIIAAAAVILVDSAQIKQQVREINNEVAQINSSLSSTREASVAARPSADLCTPVNRVLNQQEELNFLALVVVQDGSTLYISGKVPDLYTRYQVEKAVRSVPGVGAVDLSELELEEIYEVQNGDNLRSIASKLYGTPEGWKNLAELNQLSPPYTLQVGQKLLVARPGM